MEWFTSFLLFLSLFIADAVVVVVFTSIIFQSCDYHSHHDNANLVPMRLWALPQETYFIMPDTWMVQYLRIAKGVLLKSCDNVFFVAHFLCLPKKNLGEHRVMQIASNVFEQHCKPGQVCE